MFGFEFGVRFPFSELGFGPVHVPCFDVLHALVPGMTVVAFFHIFHEILLKLSLHRKAFFHFVCDKLGFPVGAKNSIVFVFYPRALIKALDDASPLTACLDVRHLPASVGEHIQPMPHKMVDEGIRIQLDARL